MRRRILLILLIIGNYTSNLLAQGHQWGVYSSTSYEITKLEPKPGHKKNPVVVTYSRDEIDTSSYNFKDKNIRFTRILKHDSIITYNGSNYIETKNSIDGHIEGIPFEVLPFILEYPILDPTEKDIVRTFNNTPNDPQSGPPNPKDYTDKVYTAHLDRKALRRIYNSFFYEWKGDYPLWYISFNGGVQIASRMVLINDPAFDKQSLIDERQQKESAILGHVFTAQGGIRLHGGNYVTASYVVNLYQGFKTDHSAVDWTMGLTTASENKKYHFKFWGVGVGYAHCNYRKTVSFKSDIGLSLLFLKRFEDPNRVALSSNPQTTDLKRRLLVGYFGLGANIRISRNFSLSIVPTEYYDFTAISKGALLTRLNNLGINVDLDFHFW